MTRPRQQVVGAVTAAAVVVAAAVVIVVAGGVTLPSFPSLMEDPDPSLPGAVAFLRGEPGDEQRCLHVIAASGAEVSRELTCGMLHGPLVWEDRDVVSVHQASPPWDRLLVDTDAGEVVDRQDGDDGRKLPVEPGAAKARDDGTELVVTFGERRTGVERLDPDGDTTVLLEHSGYGSYQFTDAVWSLDGQWALVADSAGRLLIVDPETGDARLLAEDAYEPAWGPPS